MPKSQNTSTTRQARLGAADASPDAATDSNNDQKHAPHRLPKPANDLREALFAKGRQPSDEEKQLVYQQIVGMVGPGKYTVKAHSNFCTKRQRERTMRQARKHTIAAKMQENPNPTMLDLLVWHHAIGGTLMDIFRIVETELSDVIKQRAKGECLMDSFTF